MAKGNNNPGRVKPGPPKDGRLSENNPKQPPMPPKKPGMPATKPPKKG